MKRVALILVLIYIYNVDSLSLNNLIKKIKDTANIKNNIAKKISSFKQKISDGLGNLFSLGKSRHGQRKIVEIVSRKKGNPSESKTMTLETYLNELLNNKKSKRKQKKKSLRQKKLLREMAEQEASADIEDYIKKKYSLEENNHEKHNYKRRNHESLSYEEPHRYRIDKKEELKAHRRGFNVDNLNRRMNDRLKTEENSHQRSGADIVIQLHKLGLKPEDLNVETMNLDGLSPEDIRDIKYVYDNILKEKPTAPKPKREETVESLLEDILRHSPYKTPKTIKSPKLLTRGKVKKNNTESPELPEKVASDQNNKQKTANKNKENSGSCDGKPKEVIRFQWQRIVKVSPTVKPRRRNKKKCAKCRKVDNDEVEASDEDIYEDHNRNEGDSEYNDDEETDDDDDVENDPEEE